MAKGTFSNSRGFPGPRSFFPGLCEPCKSMSHIICHNWWIYVVVMECRSLFSSTATLSQESVLEKMHPQQIAYFIYGSIPYLVCRYILGPGDSPTVSRSL